MKSYHEIAGDGGSDVVGQVEGLHASIGAALAGVRYKLAIGSGKGGVGKSTLTLALAHALRRAGRSVAILDGDFNGPCQARLAGLEGAPWIPGEHGMTLPRNAAGIGVLSFGSLLPDARPMEFDSVAQGEEQTWRATREFALLGQLLAGVDWGPLDFLLFDLPPGAERTRQFAHFLGADTKFVLVTIPSDLSRGVVARSITALGTSGDVLGYVENMAGYYCHGCGTVRPLFPTATVELPLPCLGKVPFDPELAALCDRGWPDAAERDLPSIRAVATAADHIVQALEPRS